MPHSDRYFNASRFALSRDAEILLATAFLCATAVIGFATVSDYGLAGIAMVVPLARRVVGPWAGVTALTLCLTTGYLYGSLFYSPIDVSFLFSMTAATLAIVVMAGRSVPSWAATISAGTLSGLAVATRSSGVITLVYLIGAMALCGLEAFVERQS